jgi:hypothetical protein
MGRSLRLAVPPVLHNLTAGAGVDRFCCFPIGAGFLNLHLLGHSPAVLVRHVEVALRQQRSLVSVSHPTRHSRHVHAALDATSREQMPEIVMSQINYIVDTSSHIWDIQISMMAINQPSLTTVRELLQEYFNAVSKLHQARSEAEVIERKIYALNDSLRLNSESNAAYALIYHFRTELLSPSAAAPGQHESSAPSL